MQIILFYNFIYMKKIIILMFVLFGIIQTYASDNMVMCTMDAKQCSDWSWVGRTGPNCEFVCPWDEVKTPKACTREYMPVCAEVQVQCIQAPCYPVKETFSNKCEMENNSLATYLYDGECKAEIQEDTIMCTMEYNPVCWNDGKTYGNACSASKVWVKHNWECIWTKLENQISKAWLIAIEQNISKLDDIKKITILERVIKRAETLISNTSFESVKYWVYNFIVKLAKETIQKWIFEKYIQKNISSISPSDAVLWWTWYVTKITWNDLNKAKVEYEDGHIAESIEIEIKVVDGKITTKVIN